MLIKLFLTSSILFFFTLLTGKLFFFNHKNRFIKEKSVMICAWTMILYIISALLAVFAGKFMVKPLMLFCAISPFLIGHYTTYRKLMFFTILQLIVVILGIVAVLL